MYDFTMYISILFTCTVEIEEWVPIGFISNDDKQQSLIVLNKFGRLVMEPQKEISLNYENTQETSM